jgi:hypothetical protein
MIVADFGERRVEVLDSALQTLYQRDGVDASKNTSWSPPGRG